MSKAKQNGKSTLDTITAVSVQGFKSIDKELELQIRPLTILAGVNSSGKSSVMQPLLLMKQTLESPSDPGPLLLYGENAKFTQVDQLLNSAQKNTDPRTWVFGLTTQRSGPCKVQYKKQRNNPIDIERMGCTYPSGFYWLSKGIYDRSQQPFQQIASMIGNKDLFNTATVRVRRSHCFLVSDLIIDDVRDVAIPFFESNLQVNSYIEQISRIIHIPGLRGNPQRTYRVLAVTDLFPGTFDSYTASVIAAAQTKQDNIFLGMVGTELAELGLTWKAKSIAIDDTQVELHVGRLPQSRRGGANDLVSIADVGFGVSQTLPVVVALLTAKPGQLVYIEQPEIHLHPRAQHAMAGLLVRAANRGVRVVAETHSSILLLGIQQLVAEGKLDPKDAILHWFERNDDGNSVVTSRELDEAGAFGDWPVDFDTVSLEAQRDYLDAATKKLLKR